MKVRTYRRKLAANAFCPTGPGGGQDNSCSSKMPTEADYKNVTRSLFGDDRRYQGINRVVGLQGDRFIEVQLKARIKPGGIEHLVRIDFGVKGREDTSVSDRLERESIKMVREVERAVKAYHAAGFKLQVASSDQRRQEFYERRLSRMGLTKIDETNGPAGSQTWNTSRLTMPQVRKADWDEFLAFARSRTTVTREDAVDPHDLHAVQSEWSQDRVDGIPMEKLQYPILVSRDGYVLDGNHRWIKAGQEGVTIPVLRLGLDRDDALELVRSFPKAEYVENSNPEGCNQYKACGGSTQENLAMFLHDKLGDVTGKWQGRLTAGEQKSIFGSSRFGKALLQIDGGKETVKTKVTRGFGQDADVQTYSWKELTTNSSKRLSARAKRKLANNARKSGVGPNKFDPTRTTSLRRAFTQQLRGKFALLRGKVRQLVVGEDAFGLNDPTTNRFQFHSSPEKLATVNAFCPTGPGGGQDNSCSSHLGGTVGDKHIIGGVEYTVTGGGFAHKRGPNKGRTPVVLTDKHGKITIKFEDELGTPKAPAAQKSEEPPKFDYATTLPPGLTSATRDKMLGSGGLRYTSKLAAAGDVKSWANDWYAEGIHPSDATIKNLAATLPETPIKLYRAHYEKFGHAERESWTTDKKYAEDFMSEGRKLIEREFKPNQVLSVMARIPGRESDPEVVVAHGAFAEHMRQVRDLTVNRFQFHSSPDKLAAFQDWIRGKMKSIVTSPKDEGLWLEYAKQGYAKGAGRAFDDVSKAKKFKNGEGEFYAGSKAEFMRSSFGRPETVDKIKLLASRSFSDLENVTEDVATKMGRHLVDGLTEGKNPRDVAKLMDEELDLGGNRAEVIARTEIIRAHAEGQLDSMKSMGVEQVGAEVEFSTAGDDRVCPECSELEGQVYGIDDARGVIPVHPQCRCAWLPVVGDVPEPSEED